MNPNQHPAAGYREIEHTADWSLEVWANDLPELFRQAALGMFALMELELEPAADASNRELRLSAADPESLLVAFLAELLYLLEEERLACFPQSLRIAGQTIEADLGCRAVRAQAKEIKAVTFSRLRIVSDADGWRVTVTFDV
jgi:SHS2 domain-containing protein